MTNDYTNYETQEIALAIQNEEELYNTALQSNDYIDFMDKSEYNSMYGVNFDDMRVNRIELSDLISELKDDIE